MVELPHLRCPGCGKHLQPVKSRHIPLAEKYEDCLRRCEKCRIGATNAKNPAKVKFIHADAQPPAPDKPAEPPPQEPAK